MYYVIRTLELSVLLQSHTSFVTFNPLRRLGTKLPRNFHKDIPKMPSSKSLCSHWSEHSWESYALRKHWQVQLGCCKHDTRCYSW